MNNLKLTNHITEVNSLCEVVKQRDLSQAVKIREVQRFLSKLPDIIREFNHNKSMKSELDTALEKLRMACVNNNLHEGPLALKTEQATLQSFARGPIPGPFIEPPFKSIGVNTLTQLQHSAPTQHSFILADRSRSSVPNYIINIEFLKQYGDQIIQLNLDNVHSSETIKKIIKYCPNIEILSLRNCMLTADSVKKLTELPHLRNLKRLDLSNNLLIGSEGARDLGRHLSERFEYLGLKPFFEIHKFSGS